LLLKVCSQLHLWCAQKHTKDLSYKAWCWN